MADKIYNNVRAQTAELLLKISKGQILSGQAVDRLNDNFSADSRDASLAVNILLGSIEKRRLLDHIAEIFSGREISSLDGITRSILETGLYQILFLDRVPNSAAVNESVKAAKLLHTEV